MEYKHILPDNTELSISIDINSVNIDSYGELWIPVTFRGRQINVKVVPKGLGMYLTRQEAINGKHGNVIINIDNNILQQLLNRKQQLVTERQKLVEQYYNDILNGTARILVYKRQTDYGIETRITVPDDLNAKGGDAIYSRFLSIFRNTVIENQVLMGEYTVSDLRRASRKVNKQLEEVEQERLEKELELQRQQYADTKGKAIVYVIECVECGNWRITGSSKGRLPYEAYKQALNELRAEQERLYKEQSEDGKVALSRIVIQNNDNNNKLFNLETSHYCFLIVDTAFGCKLC